MANIVDTDQLASSEANWSGSTLFAKAGYIRVQQDKGLEGTLWYKLLKLVNVMGWMLNNADPD